MSEKIKEKNQGIDNSDSEGNESTISATEDKSKNIDIQPKTEIIQEKVVEEILDSTEQNQDIVDEVSEIESANEVMEEKMESKTNTEIITELEEEKTQVPIELANYLDSSILDIKVVREEDLGKYEEAKNMSDKYHDEYSNTFMDIREKEVVTGKVVGLTDRDVLVDIGFKSEGIIRRTEFKDLPEPGEEIDIFIQTFEDRRGNIILSKERADFKKRWQEIRDCYDNEELISGIITRRIKGGMVVDLGVVQAFLPGSQLDIKPVTDFDEYLGVESEFKIVKFNELRENIVLSRKVILEGDLLEKRQAVLEDMEIGMVLEGMVKNITDFGAFVDLGGIDGLLHITDITWGRINHPSDRLSLGEKINVKVIDFDVEKVRVSLGMKQLQPEPWVGIHEKYPIDSIIEGKIVNMMNYGVFIELEEGVEGLIHISEISWTRHIKHPSDMFKVGDQVEAKILNIDHEEKKISLGIKQLTENPWDTIENKYQIGKDHEGIVRNLTQFGAFVELEEGIDGLVHVSDMSWVQLVRHPKDIMEKGDKVKVRILDVSAEERRLSLGIKQREENPWELIREEYSSGKIVKGTVLKVLDKGVIFTLADNLEGIVPLKRMNESHRRELCEKFKEGDTYDVTVQEVDEEYKKIILMIDLELGDDPENNQKPSDSKLEDVEPEKNENQENDLDESEAKDDSSPSDE